MTDTNQLHPLAGLSVPPGTVAVHWFEQNSYAVKNPQGKTFLVDPYFPRRRPKDTFIRPTAPVRESSLPTDLVLLTHADGDHTCPETLERIHLSWPRARFAGPVESIEKICDETDIPEDRLKPVKEGDGFHAAGLEIHAVLSKPHGGDPRAGIAPPGITHLGFVVTAAGLRLYFTGDLINTFDELDELVEPVAALKPDIGFLVTHPTEGEFPFFEGSVKMARRIGLQTAVPSHYACFVERTYDPKQWAALFGPDDPHPLIIPWNSHVLYPAPGRTADA